MDLKEFIRIGECDFIDFKEKYSAENSDLVHDILCLANAKTETLRTRFLIFGVTDDLTVSGVQTDPLRKTSAQVIDLLRSTGINHIPKIEVSNFNDGDLIVDCLAILDKPEKPYFLTRDYRHGSKTVRAGVVYERNGDTNTPIDRSASERHIEWMFKQRLGLDLSPQERADVYLRDASNWKYGENENGRLYFYYNLFPEFTIVQIKDERREFEEPWVNEFPDQTATMDEFHLKVGSTKIKRLNIIWCDGGRLAVSLPRQKTIGLCTHENGCPRSYYLVKDSTENLFQEMLNQTYPQNSQSYFNKVVSLFGSEESANYELEKDYNSGSKLYLYYKNTADGYEAISSGGIRKLISNKGQRGK